MPCRPPGGPDKRSDPLAQSAEQLPFKQWVRGSNPRRVTKKKDSRKAVLLFGFRRPEAASILNFKMLGGSEFRLRNSPPPLTALNLRRIRGVGQKAGFVLLRHRSFLPTQHTSEQSPLCSDAFLRTLRIGGRRHFNAWGGEKSFPLCAQRGPTDLVSKIVYIISAKKDVI